MTALEPLTGFIGGAAAFAEIIELEGMGQRLVRIARQRLAAFVTPIEVRFHDDRKRSCYCDRYYPVTVTKLRTRRWSSPPKRCTGGSCPPVPRARR